MHRWFHRIMARGGGKKREEELGKEWRERWMSGSSSTRLKEERGEEKCQTQQRRGLDPLSSSSSSLNVTQHLFHIYDGGAASPMPLRHSGDSISASDYPHYPPMHNL